MGRAAGATVVWKESGERPESDSDAAGQGGVLNRAPGGREPGGDARGALDWMATRMHAGFMAHSGI
jgi:hypothetical protein